MNDNTVLRIKVPAHLYESVKEQLTLTEAKKGKHNLGAGMEVVKEKKMKTPKDGMTKMEEKKDKVEETEAADVLSKLKSVSGGLDMADAQALSLFTDLLGYGIVAATAATILYTYRNQLTNLSFIKKIKDSAKKAAEKVKGNVGTAATASKPAVGQTAPIQKENTNLSPSQNQEFLKQFTSMMGGGKAVEEKKDRNLDELKKAKDMLEMKIKKMEESLQEKKEEDED